MVKAMWCVDIVESERGWGSKVDGTRDFETEDEANEFVKEYNSKNNLPQVPDWYMYACKPVFRIVK
jgi:hypothetical protein